MATGKPAGEIATENWQQYNTTVLSTVSHLYQSKTLSDVIFIVGEDQKQFYGHSFYLSTRSSIFQILFSNNKNENIVLFDWEPRGFEMILRYLYTDHLDLSSMDDAFDTYRTAKKLLLPYVENLCQNYIISKMTPETVFKIYEFCCGKKLVANIRYYCLKYIDKNIEDIIKSTGFIKCEMRTILMITKRSNLAISSEYKLFMAVVNWANNKCLADSMDANYYLPDVMKPFLSHIRFLAMYPTEFAKVLEEVDLFDMCEALAILMKLLLPTTSSISLPKYLNQRRNLRKHFEYFTCYPFVSVSHEPCPHLQVNDIFVIKFQVSKSDIYLLGIFLPLLQEDKRKQIFEVSTCIEIKFLESCKQSEEYIMTFSCEDTNEPFLSFPNPVAVEKEETIEIAAKIQYVEPSSNISVFRYDEMVGVYQEGDAEFIFDVDLYLDNFQISSFRYYV